MDLSLHEKFVLLTINDEKGTVAYGYAKTYGFAGAILMELFDKNLFTIDHKRIILSDKNPTAEVLQEAMELMRSKKKPPKVQEALHLLGQKMHKSFDNVIADLIEKGILKKEEKKLLWVFKVNHFPTQNPAPENLVKSKIKSIVLYGDHPDYENLCLISLVNVLDLHHEIFKKEEMKKAKKHIKELIKKQNIATDIQKIIQEEVMTAVTISLATTTVATSS